jgi:tetratricopeptide (TPR) repeat protein
MADAFMRRAIQLYSRMPGSRSRYLPVLNSHHLRIKMYLADYDSAESIARASLKEAVGDRAQQGNIALYRANLGAPLIAQNRTEEALDELQQAAQQLELHPASAPLIKPYLELGLGSVYFFSDDSQSIEKMEAHMRSARSMFEHMRTPRGFKQLWKREALAICDLALAKASAAKGDMPQADQFSNQFFQNLEQDPRILTPTLLRRINKVAQLYIDHKHFAQSERLLNVAYQIGHDAPNHPDAARTLDCFEKLLLLTDRQAEVPDMRKWLRIDYQLLAP